MSYADIVANCHAILDEAGVPGTFGPLNAPMTLIERVRGIIALPQRQRYEQMVADLRAERDRYREALERIREIAVGVVACIAAEALEDKP